MQFKLPNGQYFLPSPTITDPAVAKTLGYNVLIQGPPSVFTENLGIFDLDYNLSSLNRLSFRYMQQDTPTTSSVWSEPVGWLPGNASGGRKRGGPG